MARVGFFEGVSYEQRPELKETVICETIWGKSFQTEDTASIKTQSIISWDCIKVKKEGSWNIWNQVERCEMNQRGRWEPCGEDLGV